MIELAKSSPNNTARHNTILKMAVTIIYLHLRAQIQLKLFTRYHSRVSGWSLRRLETGVQHWVGFQQH